MRDSKIMKIDKLLIDQNPFRDFSINPIDNDQVAHLAESYRANGDFGVIPVRQRGERYEIAVGHHRMAALDSLGHHRVDCKLAEFTDDEMVSMMIAENATQYGGKPSSQADSICAAIRRLAFWFFLSDSVEDFNGLFAASRLSAVGTALSFFGDNSSYLKAKSALLENGTISYRSVHKYIGKSLGQAAIESRLPELLASGHLSNVIEKAAADAKEVEAQREEAANAKELAEEKARAAEYALIQAKHAKERLAAEKAEKAAHAAKERAEKAAEKAAKQADRQRQMEADEEVAKAAADEARLYRERSAAQKQAERRQAARDAEMERLKREREQREAMEKRRKAEREQAEAAADKQREAALIDPEVFSLLDTGWQSREFVATVKRNPEKWGRDNFDQVKFLKDLAAKSRAADEDRPSHKRGKDDTRPDKSFLSKQRIVDGFAVLDIETQRKIREMEEQHRKHEEELSKHVKAQRLVDDLAEALSKLSAAHSALERANEDAQLWDLVMTMSHPLKLRDTIENLYRVLPQMEKFFGMTARRFKPEVVREEKVINE